MTIVAAGSQQNISLAASDAVTVSTAGLAYVDLVSGAPGSPYIQRRVNAGVPQQFGPYGAPSVIRVRAVSGDASYDTALPERMSSSELAAFRSLVSHAGNITSAALSSTTGTPGQIVRLSDGNDAGALLVWAIPSGASAYAWCWWLWPQSAY